MADPLNPITWQSAALVLAGLGPLLTGLLAWAGKRLIKNQDDAISAAHKAAKVEGQAARDEAKAASARAREADVRAQSLEKGLAGLLAQCPVTHNNLSAGMNRIELTVRDLAKEVKSSSQRVHSRLDEQSAVVGKHGEAIAAHGAQISRLMKVANGH